MAWCRAVQFIREVNSGIGYKCDLTGVTRGVAKGKTAMTNLIVVVNSQKMYAKENEETRYAKVEYRAYRSRLLQDISASLALYLAKS